MNLQIAKIMQGMVAIGIGVACIAFAGGALDVFRLRSASFVSLVGTAVAIVATLTYFAASDRDRL